MSVVNDQLARLHESYLRLVERQQSEFVRNIAATRQYISDLLAEYAKQDATISRSRINTLLRDLDGLEAEIRAAADSGLVTIMTDAAEHGYTDMVSAVAAANKAYAAAAEYVTTARVTESAILSDLAGRKPSPRNIATYLAERTGPDGLTLSDRVWQFAGDQRADVSNVIRRGVIRGDTTAKMTREVQAVYQTEEWKARRLALTESNTAYRTAIGYVAEQSDFVSALRLIPGIHRSEKCVAVSQRNPHGLGVGVFLPTDSYIYNIHPNCTAYTQFIIKDEEDDADANR